jgi:hypothetical protein
MAMSEPLKIGAPTATTKMAMHKKVNTASSAQVDHSTDSLPVNGVRCQGCGVVRGAGRRGLTSGPSSACLRANGGKPQGGKRESVVC